MESDGDSQENTPTNKNDQPPMASKATPEIIKRNVIELVKEHVNRILHQVGRVSLQHAFFVLLRQCRAKSNPCAPTNVRLAVYVDRQARSVFAW